MEALTDPAKPNQPQFLELWFSNNAFTSESRFAFELEDTETLQEVMGTLYLFCKYATCRDQCCLILEGRWLLFISGQKVKIGLLRRAA